MGSLGSFPTKPRPGRFQAQSVPKPQRRPGHSIPPNRWAASQEQPLLKTSSLCLGLPASAPSSLNKIKEISGNPHQGLSQGSQGTGLLGHPLCPWGFPAVWEGPHPQTMRRLPLLVLAPQALGFRLGQGAAPQGPGAALSVLSVRSVCGVGGFVCSTWGEGESKRWGGG